ncbi:decarboxylase [Acinetobacter sp. ANC 4558]|uniref:decarboxylase n=1 Tax=Acinetobacter sp. ANC 4558 TaxID=1977876 RepID=UPI000A342382|nr:decarboxylase [Acinetobacter sp. ANC 4558]
MIAPSLRADLWIELLSKARLLASKPEQKVVDEYSKHLEHIRKIEKYFAFPSLEKLHELDILLKEQEYKALLKNTQFIATAIISEKYMHDASLFEDRYLDDTVIADRTPSAISSSNYRPYFEVLSVVPHEISRWQHIVHEARQMRRPEDEFVYEPVVVGNATDALTAIILNSQINAVVLYQGFTTHASEDNSIIEGLKSALNLDLGEDESEHAIKLAKIIHHLRPEIDIYLLSDFEVEKIVSSAESKCIRRVFYQVEEPLELHLSIIEGIHERYETPFFNNLKKYALKPISTFHALPIARGKSVFKSNWIRDMGEFYGVNLFLAESSATTGGLDSLLEPTGNIKVSQERAAKAFGAKEAYFVTNGTSTSNKIVLQALLAPGDIAVIDRNCHKSHHYGCVLAGAQPYYVEAYPLTEYSMYGAVPLREIKTALLNLRDEGLLDRVKLVDLTNCTFDGQVYNVRLVMEECLAIKPDLVFLWDEAWFGFAHWSPLLRKRTAMGAAKELTEWFTTAEAQKNYDDQQATLGAHPSKETLLNTRLYPDPSQAVVRVYQTNSVHKSMSALRQGSIILAHDVYHHQLLGRFKEAIFTHSTTSPNQQLIASLDIARRQMELEGYGLVNNSIQVALTIRREVNNHPLISKYFRILTNEEMVPEAYRVSGVKDYTSHEISWADAARSIQEDEFLLDPTRITLFCGSAGFDGTSLKKLLADKYNIQLNKTSRNSVLLQSNINNTRSDVAALMRVLMEISSDLEDKLKEDGQRIIFDSNVKSLVEDVPHLPNFSRFESRYKDDQAKESKQGDIRRAFFDAYDDQNCSYILLNDHKLDELIAQDKELISANFVIPYPPGFPILVPGQIITLDVVTFMRKLDVKEVHGYDAIKGLKVIGLF